MIKLIPSLLILILCGFICHYDPNAKSERTNPGPPIEKLQADSTVSLASKLPRTSQDTAFTSNFSRIAGTVKSIITADTLLYQLSAHVDSSSAIGDMPNYAEAGSDIVLSPHYSTDSRGGIDLTQSRNKRLLRLRLLKEGEHFRARIIRQPLGNWTIVEVDSL